MHRHWTGLWIAALFIGLYGCKTTSSSTEEIKLPGCEIAIREMASISVPSKVSILPVKVEISEFSAGGTTEEVPEWSAEGTKLVDACVRKYCDMNLNMEIIPLQDLSEEDKALLDQYRALYEVVAANQQYIKGFPAWRHLTGKVATLGNGLAVFRKQVGADAILFVSGYDLQSSAGRKAAFAIYAVLTGGGALQMGHSVLHTAMVELESGDILWTHTNASQSSKLNNDVDVDAMVRSSFADFPSTAKKE